MKVLFVPNLGKARKIEQPKWGADFFADAFLKQSAYDITIEYNLNNRNNYDLVWVHNIANLLKGVKGRLKLVSQLQKCPPIIGGVRGQVGINELKLYLGEFDSIHTGTDKIAVWASQYNRNVYSLSSGVDLNIFVPGTPPEEFCVGWVGDTKKKMKNLHIIKSLDIPVKYATKENYIPHDLMPTQFFNKVSAIVHASSHEGSSRVIMESAACGLPIICTNVGHNRTIVAPEWMFTLDNPIPQIGLLLERLKSDRGLARRVGFTNRENVKQYSWQNIIAKADMIIEETLARQGG